MWRAPPRRPDRSLPPLGGDSPPSASPRLCSPFVKDNWVVSPMGRRNNRRIFSGLPRPVRDWSTRISRRTWRGRPGGTAEGAGVLGGADGDEPAEHPLARPRRPRGVDACDILLCFAFGSLHLRATGAVSRRSILSVPAGSATRRLNASPGLGVRPRLRRHHPDRIGLRWPPGHRCALEPKESPSTPPPFPGHRPDLLPESGRRPS